MSSSSGGWSARRPKPVKSEGDVVDLGAKFGISVGSDSDSSDAEFAPETEERDSADSGDEGSSSGEDGGDEGDEEENEVGMVEEGEDTKEKEEVESEAVSEAGGGGTQEDVEEREGESTDTNLPEPPEKETDRESEEDPKPAEEVEGEATTADERDGAAATPEEYDPLIVRRSRRAIKPTKDVDLYLLGAKFGIDVDGLSASGGESSDIEFAPAEDSPESLSESSADDSGTNSGKKGKKHNGKEDEDEDREMEVGTEASTLQQKVISEDEFSRSVSEMSISQDAVQQVKVEVHVALCAVCLEDSLDGDIVECDHCGISVHEGCYGVPDDAGAGDDKSSVSSFTTIPWFCDTCKAGVNPLTCACELCPMRGGLYKQATNGRWVHMVCSLYTPGIEYVEPSLLSGVTLDCLSAARWGGKRCQLCEDEFYSRTGVCIGCDAGLCKSFFHVTCAQQQGLLCEMDSDDENTDVADPYFAHCKAHSDKTILKRKRRDFLTVANQQKRFKFDESNDRIKHYLSKAKSDYARFFKKMIAYYRPELTAHFEDRFFHFKPSALRRLTKKAQLLGFTVEMDQGGTKRKVVPDLTTEFVNHFNERQTRKKELQEQEKRLTASHQELREEELKMKHKVVSLEKELNSLKIEGQEMSQCASALYVCLSRLSGELTDETERESAESVREKEEKVDDEKSSLPECVVCEKQEDAHLMALCDTCNKNYHIHCLDPPLSRVPKKTSKWGWQCHRCCFESGDDLAPTIANFDEPASRCGRKINAPKVFTFPEDQVKPWKPSKKSTGKKKTKT